jgi:hypothetical protein
MKLCGRGECIFQSIEKMIEKMKEEIARTQNIGYNDQLVVADIYYVTAYILSEACRLCFDVKREDCEPSTKFQKERLTMDTFIMLKQLKDDGFVAEEYGEELFNSLLKIKPEMKGLVEKDHAVGLV